MVGAKGFEPSTPWSQTKCANQTALRPDKTSYRDANYTQLKSVCQDKTQALRLFSHNWDTHTILEHHPI